MSLPQDWDFTVRGLITIVKEGRDSIYASIKELRQYGYCDVVACRDDNGKMVGNDYIFFEEPHVIAKKCDSPYTEKPDTAKPNTENQPQINKEDNKDKEITNVYITNRFKKPTVEEINSYCQEKGFSLDAQQIYDHYEMVGWKYGKGHQPIKDWKAAVRTWVRNSANYRNYATTSTTQQNNQAAEHPSDSELREQSIRIIERLSAERKAREGTLWE